MFNSVKYQIFLCAVCCMFSSFAITPFKNNEKVVFLGDSITHGGDYLYWTQVMYQLRNPGKKLRLENAGISGDSAGGGLGRLQYDVLDKKPDRVFIMFGMNDINLTLYAKGGTKLDAKRLKPLKSYERYMNLLCDRLKKAGVPVVLMTPTPYNQYGKNNPSTYNEVGLGTAGKIVRKTAKEKGLQVVEFYDPMTEIIKKQPKYSPMRTDKVHPNSLGHLLMAYYLCKAADLDGKIAEVTLDAADGKVKTVRHAVIRNIKTVEEGWWLTKTVKGISFEYTPERLPFITDEKQHSGIDTLVPFTADFNTELMQITGLEQGKYQLLADGSAIGVFSSEELEKGINLAVLDTPSRRQAQKMFQQIYTIKRCFGLLRTVVQCDRFARAYKADINDPQSCFKAVDKWFDVRFGKNQPGNKKYYSIVIANYKKDKLRVADTLKKLSDAYNKLYQESRPVSYKLELKKQ